MEKKVLEALKREKAQNIKTKGALLFTGKDCRFVALKEVFPFFFFFLFGV